VDGDTSIMIMPGDHSGCARPDAGRASEERFRIAAECANYVVFELETGSPAVSFFGRAREIAGFDPADFPTAQAWAVAIHPEDRARVEDAFSGEYRMILKDGSLRHWSVRCRRIEGGAGQTRVVGVIEDITGRKHAEEQLRLSEERFRIAAQSASDIIFEWDLAAGDVRAYASTTPAAPPLTMNLLRAIVHPDDIWRLTQAVDRNIATGEPIREEIRITRQPGKVSYWLVRGQASSPENKDRRMVGVATNITGRKRAERVMRASRERFRIAAQSTSDVILELDIATGRARSYEPLDPKLGFTSRDLAREGWTALLHPDDRERVLAEYQRHLETGEPLASEFRIAGRDGAVRYWSLRGGAYIDGEGNPKLIAAATDVTRARMAQEELRLSEERFRIAAQSTSDLIFEWSLADDRIEYFGGPSAGIRMEAGDLPRCFSDWKLLLHPEDRDRVLAALDGHFHEPGPVTIECRIVLGGGVRHVLTRASAIFDERGRPLKSVGTFNDITDRKRAEEALQRLAAIVRSSEDAIIGSNADFEIVSWNRAAERLFGHSFEEAAGRSISLIVPEEHREESRKLGAMLLAGQSPQEIETFRLHKDGRRVPVSVTLSPIHDSANRIVGFSATMRDITARKRSEAVLRESEQRFRRLFEDNPVGILLTSPESRVFKANAAMCRMLGYEESELTGKSIYDFTCPDDCEPNEAFLAAVLRDENPDAFEKRYIRKNGQVVWASVKVSLQRGDDGAPRYMVSIVQDITEQKKAQNLLSYRAMHDLLTGLPNRRLLEERLAQEIRHACRENTQVALFYIDLDRFKLVNDTLGHVLGDALLRQVAYRLHHSKRAADTLARLGGDEFLLMAAIPDPAAAEAIAERLMDAFARHFHVRGHDLFVGASIGISLYPRDGADITTLQRNADAAMYAAKRRGMHSYEFFSPELGAAALERLQLENDMRRAIDRGEFEVYYQPLLDLKRNRVAAFEALLRWRHPERGPIPPSKFIPIAEETGLIVRIGRWVLEEACRLAMERRLSGHPPVRIGVNVSVFQFAQPDFVAMVGETLKTYGVEPRWLELEVTESIFMQDLADSAQKIAELREMGISIAIDDFGTGYSSFSYLQRLPIDALKIDRSFVQDIGTLPNVISLLRAMASLAKSLGMRVVVEGIETEEQLRAVREIGCDEAQGYLFGMPAPAGRTGLELLCDRVGGPSVGKEVQVQLPLAELGT
jgi:diguanylate cyclase (GGDEF)-like protein/PAS domain S-box-containing protein